MELFYKKINLKMSVLWIRHGEKKFKNGKAVSGFCNHDPPLKEDCDYKINMVGKSIYLKLGIPDKIICSPFLRTRETANKLKNFFVTNHNKDIDIIIDNNISEFLGWVKPPGLKAQVTSETSRYISPILGVEKIKDVEKRSKLHVDSINTNEKIVIITHGIVIEFIHKYLTGVKLNNIKELGGIIFSGKIVEEFANDLKNYKEKYQ